MRIEWKPDSGANDDSNEQSEESTLSPVTDISSGHEKVLHPMKGMTAKQRFQYIMTYYAPKAFAIIVIAGIVAALIINFVLHREGAVKLILVNHYMEDTNELSASFNDFLHENGFKPKDFVEINTEIKFTLHDQVTDHMDFQSLQIAIATRKYTGFFADEEIFQYYADQMYFRDLSIILTDEQLKALTESDSIMYGKTYETEEAYPCGIKLTKETCEWLKLTNYRSECYYGVLFDDMSDEMAFNLTQYILNYKLD